jgi:hypothetical protein
MLGLHVFLKIVTADLSDVMAINTCGFSNRETMQEASIFESLL